MTEKSRPLDCARGDKGGGRFGYKLQMQACVRRPEVPLAIKKAYISYIGRFFTGRFEG